MQRLDKYLTGRFRTRINDVVGQHRQVIMDEFLKSQDFRGAAAQARWFLGNALRRYLADSRALLGIMLRGYCPRVWGLLHRQKS